MIGMDGQLAPRRKPADGELPTRPINAHFSKCSRKSAIASEAKVDGFCTPSPGKPIHNTCLSLRRKAGSNRRLTAPYPPLELIALACPEKSAGAAWSHRNDKMQTLFETRDTSHH
jgi:hypothetical protein